MSEASISEVFDDFVVAKIYGRPVSLTVDGSGFDRSLRPDGGDVLKAVMVSAIQAFGSCHRLPNASLMLLPGEGSQGDGGCGIGADELMWKVGLDSKLACLEPSVQSVAQVVGASSRVEPLGFQVYFEGVTESNGVVSGRVVIDWEENVAGKRVVIIRQSVPFSIAGRTRIYEDSFEVIWGVKLRVYVDAYFDLGARSVCIEARATWPGGNIGKNFCQKF